MTHAPIWTPRPNTSSGGGNWTTITMDESSGNGTMDLSSDDPCSDLVEKHDFITIKFVVLTLIGSSVAIFGIFGNLTTAVVMSRPSMRLSSNHLYLTALSIFDTLLLFPSIMLYSLEPVSEYFDMPDLYVIWIKWVPHCFALSHFAQTGSVYITVSATFERYMAVLYPKHAEVQCTKHRTALTVIGVTCFSAVFNCTKYFEIVVAHYENCTGFTAYELIPSAMLQHRIYSVVYTLWLSQFVMVFLPFGVLLAVNTAIVWAFRRSLKQVKGWQRLSRRISVRCLDGSEIMLERAALKEQSRDATRVLATIVCVFLICNCLGFVVTVLESIYGPAQLGEMAPRLYAFSRDAINFLAIVNSSINFVVCCTFGQDFRAELAAMFGCTSHRRRLMSRRRRQCDRRRGAQTTRKRKRGAAAGCTGGGGGGGYDGPKQHKSVERLAEPEPSEMSPLQYKSDLFVETTKTQSSATITRSGRESYFALVL